jgi:hypothetical protein
MFNVAFNTPADYDLATGIIDVNANNRRGQPQELYTYTAFECKSTFSKGVFKQELQGKLLIEKNINAPATGGRTATPTAANTRSSPRTAEQIVAEQNASFNYGTTEGSEQTRLLAEQDAGLFDEAPPTPRPAPPPQPATSNGDIDYSTASALVPTAPTPVPRRNFGQTDIDFSTQSAVVPTPPQIMNRDT